MLSEFLRALIRKIFREARSDGRKQDGLLRVHAFVAAFEALEFPVRAVATATEYVTPVVVPYLVILGQIMKSLVPEGITALRTNWLSPILDLKSRLVFEEFLHVVSHLSAINNPFV